MVSFLTKAEKVAEARLDNHLSMQAAAEYSGYNIQYLRRLVRHGVIRATKVGQMWLVLLDSLEAYLQGVREADDRRFGPRVYQVFMESQEQQTRSQ